METVTFDLDLSIEENLEKVLAAADSADPQLAKLLREHISLMAVTSADSARKSARSMFHKLTKDRLDELAAEVEL